MKKRILAILLTLAMIVGMLPVAAMADDQTAGTESEGITVYVTGAIEGVFIKTPDGTPLFRKPVQVKDLNDDGKYSYHEAMVAAHEAYCPGGYSWEDLYDEYENNEWFVSTDKMWGQEFVPFGNLLNGETLVSTKWNEDYLEAGDHIEAYILSDNINSADFYTLFDQTEVTVDLGTEFTLNLKGYQTGIYDDSHKNLDGMTIGTWEDGKFVEIEGKKTAADGNVTLSFDKAGTYYVTATGMHMGVYYDYTDWQNAKKVEKMCYICPPCCVVTVENVITGSCGDNLKWNFSEQTGTLTISGTGAMEDYSYNVYAPWNDYVNDISTIVVEEGVTYIGKYAFNNVLYASFICLPSTLTEIGSSAFASSYSRKVTPMIAFGGTQEQWNAIDFHYSSIKSDGAFTYNTARTDVAQITTYPSSDLFFISDDDASKALSATIAKPEGVEQVTLTWYVNESKSTTGGTPVDEKWVSVSEDGLTSYCTPDLTLYGTHYYYCVVSTEIGEETVEVNSTVSTVEVMQRLWSGRGTQEDPFKLATSKDLVKLSNLVAEGNTCENMYFAITANITLPKGWEPIGGPKAGVTYTPAISYRNMNIFKGHIDGLKNAKTGECYTITVPAGEKTMVGAIVGGSIKNLNIYGKRIEGYGVVEYYFNMTASNPHNILIENVTLKSGTHTKYSGFIGGYASGVNTVTIRNCTVEEGVVIGDDGTYPEWAEELQNTYSYNWGPDVGSHESPKFAVQYNDMIGSFGGGMSGTIENCVSYAKVYGRDYVGGILGYKGQSMGDCIIRNCVFAGEVHATGELAGGIVGAGYIASTAPNTPGVTIENCAMIGSVEGNDKVGGIIGGNTTAKQMWNNGLTYIRSNYVIGSVKGNTYVGGIIGYINGLDRYNIISNNYYLEGIAENGIAHIKSVDTETTDYKRFDDPTGADADKLATSFTRAELKNGTLMRKLNEAGTGYAWTMKDGKLTITDTNPVVYLKCATLNTSSLKKLYRSDGLKALDDYTVTVTYFDGTTKEVKASECIVDIDLTQSAKVVASLTYDGYTLYFGVEVVADEEPSEEVKAKDVDIMIGWLIRLTGEPEPVSAYALRSVPSGISIRDKQLFKKVKAVYDALDESTKQLVERSAELQSAEEELIEQETAIKEEIKEVLDLINAIGDVNDASAEKIVEARDAYENLSDDAKYYIAYHSNSEQEELFSKEDEYEKQLEEVIDLINSIGEVNYFSAGKIQAARDAYDALSEDNKTYMSNRGYYDVLVEAEEAYTKLLRAENGVDGEDGADGISPILRINEETNMWEVSYDNGENWTSLDVPATGDKGEQGEQGEKGDTGAAGANGITPLLHINEKTNEWEVSYDNGETWISLGIKATGDKGNTGVQGDKGDKGDKGDTGADGKDGITPQLRINAETNEWEVSYDNGETWTSLGVKATGDKGEQGAQGEKGDKGDTGAQGEKGDKGDTGAQGEKGDKGDTGAQGEKGDNGVDGANGKDGVDGKDGANGADGKNASNALTVVTMVIAIVSLAGNVIIFLLLKKKRA